MLKQTITYTDYDGVERTEDYYFNLTKIELNKLLNSKENLKDKLDAAVANEDVVGVIDVFEELVSKSYGVRSEDNKTFKKSKELSEEFLQTAACSALLDELMDNDKAMMKFIEGIIPAAVAKELAENNTEQDRH